MRYPDWLGLDFSIPRVKLFLLISRIGKKQWFLLPHRKTRLKPNMVIMGGWILQNPCQNQVKTTLDFWVFFQWKADSRDILVGTIYRPPNQNSEFFTAFPKLMENMWTKFSNIVILGDFNTNLLEDERGDTLYERNKILEQFNMRNVVKGPTRSTNHLSLIHIWRCRRRG